MIRRPSAWPILQNGPLLDVFMSAPEPGLQGRPLRYLTGKVLGGGSSVNSMFYERPPARYVERWAAAGARPGRGWSLTERQGSI